MIELTIILAAIALTHFGHLPLSPVTWIWSRASVLSLTELPRIRAPSPT